MPGDPRLRASDADRERTVELLREHHAVGRLTAEEFNSRLEQAFAARTLGELDELLADLPAIDLYQLPSAGIRPTRRGGSGPRLRGDASLVPSLENSWGGWLTGSALLIAVWVVIGIGIGGLAWVPWFALIIAPWALSLAARSRRQLSPARLRALGTPASSLVAQCLPRSPPRARSPCFLPRRLVARSSLPRSSVRKHGRALRLAGKGLTTVTRTAALCFASGPTIRKTPVAVSGGLSSLNPPRGPVTPLATNCHAVVPASRSNNRTGTSAAAAPPSVTRPANATAVPAGTRSREAVSVSRYSPPGRGEGVPPDVAMVTSAEWPDWFAGTPSGANTVCARSCAGPGSACV
jgi:hypothetical protein